MADRSIQKKKADSEWAKINPVRIYTDIELADFHKKIQKFWKPYTLLNGEVTEKFYHEELAVSFGAARIVVSGKQKYYLYNSERNAVLSELWNQYENWKMRQNWPSKPVPKKQIAEASAVLDKIPF